MKPMPRDRTFGFFMSAVFAAFGLFRLFKQPTSGSVVIYGLFLVASVLLAVALVRPRLLHPLNRAWFWLGETLGRIINPLVLSIIYFLLLTPIALVGRWRGRDVLRLKKKAAGSYWVEREPGESASSSFEHQF